MRNPLFVALDVDNIERADELVQETRAFVGGFKVGPRAVMRFGPEWVKRLSQSTPVFVDQKYFDIPSTMVAAVRASFDMGASFCTVHAQCGQRALGELAILEKELNQKRYFRILAVTILTSMSENDLPQYLRPIPINQQVKQLADEVIQSGLSGLVCSVHEVAELRAKYAEAYLLTPGIRMSQDASGDQSRVDGPLTALKAGASGLVVGRPIIEAVDPAQSAKIYYEEIQKFAQA